MYPFGTHIAPPQDNTAINIATKALNIAIEANIISARSDEQIVNLTSAFVENNEQQTAIYKEIVDINNHVKRTKNKK